MNPYLEPHGFLGTGASLLADITLLAYLILIIPAMVVGFGFARRKLFRPYHKWTMTTITIVNWVLVIFLMFTAYRYDVVPNIGTQTGNTRYLLPTIHGIIGLVAQLLATFVIIRMFREDRQVARAKARGEKDTSKYWFKSAKPIMRLTLTLWLITAVLGVFNYLTRYDLIPTYKLSAEVIPPASTAEIFGAQSPNGTEELTATSPDKTEELTAQAPAQTQTLAAPIATASVVAPVRTVEIFVPMVTVEIVTATPSPTNTPLAPVSTEETNIGSLQTLIAPAATPEQLPLNTTPELLSPNATAEVSTASSTPSPTNTATRTVSAPASTPEILAPLSTEETTETVTPTPTPTIYGWIKAVEGASG